MSSVFSSNAQLIDHPNNRPLFEARYPLLDPQEQLVALRNLNKNSLLIKRLNDRLRDTNFNSKTLALQTSKQHFCGHKTNYFATIIKKVLKAVMKYAESYLAPHFPSQFRTVTTTEKKTSYFSCTVSTTACAGRHRRAVIKHLLDKKTDLLLGYPMLAYVFLN